MFTLPPTPPPDIDLEAWRESLAKIRAWKPETVFITHFGPYGGAAEHLDHFETSLSDVAEMARRIIQTDASDDAKYASSSKSEVLALCPAAPSTSRMSDRSTSSARSNSTGEVWSATGRKRVGSAPVIGNERVAVAFHRWSIPIALACSIFRQQEYSRSD